MRVEVYADTFNNKNESTLVWSGQLQQIPREGDVIFIVGGWGGSRVRTVYWELNEDLVELHIDDKSEAYKREFGEAERLPQKSDKDVKDESGVLKNSPEEES